LNKVKSFWLWFSNKKY